ADLEQALFRLTEPSMGRGADGTAQYHASGVKGTVADGIGGTEDADHGNAQGGGQVHGAGVAADEKAGTPGESDQLGKRTLDGNCRAVACGLHLAREAFFAGAHIHQGTKPLHSESLRDPGVAVRGPLLGAPSGAGIQDGEVADLQAAQAASAGFFGEGVAGELYFGHGERGTGDRFSEGKVLLNDVSASSNHLAGVKHAGGVFPRLRNPIQRSGAGPSSNQGGADRALEINYGLIARGAQFT